MTTHDPHLSTDVPSVEEQIREAQLDNAASWRSAWIVSVILILTIGGIPIALIVMIATASKVNSRIAQARRGEYLGSPAAEAAISDEVRRRDKQVQRWVFGGVLGVAGALIVAACVASHSAGGVVIGALLVVAGVLVVVRPWEM